MTQMHWIECWKNGHRIEIKLGDDNIIDIYTDGKRTQRALTIKEFVNWVGNALEDGSEGSPFHIDTKA